MANILIINSSAKNDGSISRMLVAEFVEKTNALVTDHQITYRDLVAEPIPILNDEIVDIIRTHPDLLTAEQRQLTALSETLIAELKAADVVVIGSPMYNWMISASLKTWIDQIMRIGLTFEYRDGGVGGLLGDKPVLAILSRGGSYDSPERAAVDLQKPYLTNVFNVIGLTPTFISMEGSLMGEEVFNTNIAKVRAEIDQAIDTLFS